MRKALKNIQAFLLSTSRSYTVCLRGVALFNDLGCSTPAEQTKNVESHAITTMTEMRDQGVLAFIGSSISCKNEALVAAAWNIPMVAFVSHCRASFLVFSHKY